MLNQKACLLFCTGHRPCFFNIAFKIYETQLDFLILCQMLQPSNDKNRSECWHCRRVGVFTWPYSWSRHPWLCRNTNYQPVAQHWKKKPKPIVKNHCSLGWNMTDHYWSNLDCKYNFVGAQNALKYITLSVVKPIGKIVSFQIERNKSIGSSATVRVLVPVFLANSVE